MAQRDPHSCWDDQGPQIKHIDFNLHVDFDQHVLRGTAEYRFDRRLGAEFSLDTRDLHIEKITADGRQVAWSIGDATFLGRVLRIYGTWGSSSLQIDFQTSPNAAALQWLAPEQTAGKTHPYVFSQCQAILARTVFPCHDTPAVRFTYGATLRVPRELKAVMAALPVAENGEGGETAHEPINIRQDYNLLVAENDGGGETVCRFEMRHPIPSYLFAFAAGNIVAEKIGTRSKVFAEPEVVQAAAWEFADVDKMIEGAESLFGPYIWDEFNLLVMPPSFPYGGMENPTLTFLTPTLIAGDRSLVAVVAHELAHSWTGNFVTNATWEDFWLNEGWTVYAERRIVERLYGPELANLQAANGLTSLTKAFENFGGADSPYTKLKTDLTGIDPDDVFSAVPYEKGFLFLVTIERVVGRQEFDKFIQSYMYDFGFCSLTTKEFVEYLEEKLPQARNAVNLARWIHDPGLPPDARIFRSQLVDDVCNVQKLWDAGDRELRDVMSRWNVDQKVLFLEGLPLKQSAADCAALEKLFDIEQTRNSEILVPWFCIAAGSNYEQSFPAIHNFLGIFGRGKYLRPIYRALHQNPATRDLARKWFDEFKDRYHSVGRNAVARILETI